MARKLTEKQKNFAKNVVSGMTYKDAYINSYNFTGNDNTAYIEGSKLALREDIQNYIQTLSKPLEIAHQTTVLSERDKKRAFLWDMINKDSASDSDKLKAVDLLNKMDSEYININKNIDSDTPKISNLDTDKLKKLIG